MNKPHKHEELIKAWADGAEIQRQVLVDICVDAPTDEWEWIDDENPDWHPERRYRIKLKEKEKVKMWKWLYKVDGEYYASSEFFKNKEEAYESLVRGYRFELLQRIDWSEIEVEVDE